MDSVVIWKAGIVVAMDMSIMRLVGDTYKLILFILIQYVLNYFGITVNFIINNINQFLFFHSNSPRDDLREGQYVFIIHIL